jgi:4-amino-4-deoxychorismate lyase
MLDTEDRLICGTMSNVFICRENSIATPAVTRCGVLGVMRQQVLSILDEAGQACEIRDIKVDELRSASEVFLTNSQFGVLPVRQLDSTNFPVGEVSRDIMDRIARNGVTECAR